MSLKPAIFITSALACFSLIASSLSAEAGGTSRIGSWSGSAGHGASVPSGPNCKQTPSRPSGNRNIDVNKPITVYKPVNINNNVDVNKPISVNKNIDVNKPVTVNKNIDVNKPVTVEKNIDVNKPISIEKNINNSKNINITNNINVSKNIDINKPVTINKGGKGGGKSSSSSQSSSQAEAAAVAAAVAAALASSNSSSSAVVNFNGGNNSSTSSSSASAYNNAGSESSASAFGYSGAGTVIGGSSYIAETPGAFAGGDIGTVNVEMPAPTPVAAQCTYQDTTVIKAIHAVCISADHQEFPASHMTADTWIEASYEGEVARCIPGSHLKVTVGAVYQSNEGLASSWSHGQVLECGLHEAVRHYKDGMLKCAPAVPVPDCTERTNLRKWGTADMFFTYRTKVCLETHQEYSEQVSEKESVSKESYESGGYTPVPHAQGPY